MQLLLARCDVHSFASLQSDSVVTWGSFPLIFTNMTQGKPGKRTNYAFIFHNDQ